MSQTKYLIVGSSHAGLSALEAIRLYDQEGPVTILSSEEAYPYSPTILPYVVSGEVPKERAFLRDHSYFEARKVRFLNGTAVTALQPGKKSVLLDSGKKIAYEKLLLATGAAPEQPPIPGLDECRHYRLRTLEDALEIQRAMKMGASAIVLGGGLIGMHAAENMAKAGLKVTVVEMLPQILPGYFDVSAAGLIQKVFTLHGVKIFTGSAVTHVTSANGACAVSLANGLDLSAHFLLVATGVRPRTAYLAGSHVKVDAGILVDDRMRTSVENIWAAGDVAQAGNFFGPEKILNGILPDAVEQGWIAGMDMAGDPSLKPYAGGIPMNTYSFFGNRSFSVGVNPPDGSEEGFEVDQIHSPAGLRYQKLVFHEGRLVGASAINTALDPGIMWQMIRRRVEMGDGKGTFAGSPLETGRLLMSRLWR